jgi:hypothetical protein
MDLDFCVRFGRGFFKFKNRNKFIISKIYNRLNTNVSTIRE